MLSSHKFCSQSLKYVSFLCFYIAHLYILLVKEKINTLQCKMSNTFKCMACKENGCQPVNANALMNSFN